MLRDSATGRSLRPPWPIMAATVLLVVTGCGKGSQVDVVGKWELDQEATRNAFPNSSLGRADSKERIDITFGKDGTVIIAVTGKAEQTGTWTQAGQEVQVDFRGSHLVLRRDHDLLIDQTPDPTKAGVFRRRTFSEMPSLRHDPGKKKN